MQEADSESLRNPALRLYLNVGTKNQTKQMHKSILIVFLFLSSCCFAQKTSLWGTWEFGGDNHAGNVYSIDAEGNSYKELYSFPSIVGEWPKGDLCKGKDGIYYGVAAGGLHKGGILFLFDLKQNRYKILHHFDKSEGRRPQGGLILEKEHLYGVTYEGGKNRKGTIFRYNLKKDSIVVLHHFEGKDKYSNIGKKTKLSLLGKTLFGLIERGGEYSKGVLYSLNLKDLTFKNCINFNDSIGTYPRAPLTISKTGKIFGSTAKGITSKDGKIFKYDPIEKKLNILLSFDEVEGNYLQSQMALMNDSMLVGVTSFGGKSRSGVIFEFNVQTKDYITTKHLSKKSTGSTSKGTMCTMENGNIYGYLSKGGRYNCGSVYRYNFLQDDFKVVHEFNKHQGYDLDNGLIVKGDDELLGLAKSGGKSTRYGNIFSLKLSNSTYNQLLNFQDSPNGKKPIGNLISYNGFVYGVTQYGGKSDKGTIYRISTKKYNFEKLIDLIDYGIEDVSGGLALDDSGKMYGFSESLGNKSAPGIFCYNPKTNEVSTLLKFVDKKEMEDLSIPQDNSVTILNRNNGQVLSKYTNEPDSIDLTLKEQESDAILIVTNNHKAEYPSDKPVGTPLISGSKLFGLFYINDTHKNGGIFSVDLKTKKFKIVEYFKSQTVGNLIDRNGNLLYVNYDGAIDSTSIKSANYFDPKKDGGPYGYTNLINDTFYYFPYTWDGLYRKSPNDSIPQLVIGFGISSPYAASRKEIMNDKSLSRERDLASIHLYENGKLVEKDKFNAQITGSVLKGPLLEYSNMFYGITRAGGKFGSGVFFKYDPESNSFFKLHDFLERKSGYSGGVLSSLLLIKK